MSLRAILPLLIASAASAQPLDAHRIYDTRWAAKLVPLVVEAVRFPTYAGNERAFVEQKAWLERTAHDLGFTFGDRGKVIEIDLPAGAGAPVLGLAVHGDVVPVDDHWTFPPFEGTVKDGMLQGRGVADDKGPLVQALLAMRSLADSGRPRTHTIRLLVGSDEETGDTDFREYLAANRAPNLTLVLDSQFPVLVGEMAVSNFFVETALDERAPALVRVVSLAAGLAGNIVPDTATARIQATPGTEGATALASLRARLQAAPLPAGIRLEIEQADATLVVRTRGKAAHAGMNPNGGRNALVALALLLEPELPPGGAHDLLAFVKVAGQDLHGTALGLTDEHPVFGRSIAVPTMIRAMPEGKFRVNINIRSFPGLSGETLKARLFSRVAQFNAQTGSALQPGGTFASQPLEIHPESKLVKRLLAAYRRATGRTDSPTVVPGATYAKLIPNSVVYGMWFPGKPYPGHDVDERIAVADLHLGTHALIEALVDLACGQPLADPLQP